MEQKGATRGSLIKKKKGRAPELLDAPSGWGRLHQVKTARESCVKTEGVEQNGRTPNLADAGSSGAHLLTIKGGAL